MQKNTSFLKYALQLVFIFSLLSTVNAVAQVLYSHNFNTTAAYPFNDAPATLNAALSGSSWTNNKGSWVNFTGATGNALGLADSSDNAKVTLTFNIAAGKQLQLNSYSFWRKKSPSGATNYEVSINGVNAGSGVIPSTGANTGLITLPAPAALSGTVTIVISLVVTNPLNVGTFAIDDFVLNGTVLSPACTAPVVTLFSPASGPENTVVTLNGNNFEQGAGVTSVKFNGTEAAGFTVVSNTIIKAVVPAGAATGTITLTNDTCTGSSSSFTVLASACTTVIGGSEIYISELYDQKAGSGGMIELYNPTANTISLNGYVLQRYGDIDDNTPTPGYILPLTGSIGSEETYLIACSTPNQAICPAPLEIISFGAGFNGNDKIELLKNNVVIDRVLVPFTGPGFTLIRKDNAAAPTPAYSVNDWDNTQHNDVVPNTYCSTLGSHITVPVLPAIATQPVSKSICEGETTTFAVTATNANGFNYQWKMLNTAGTWVNVVNNANYSGAGTATLTITQAPFSFSGNQYYCTISSGTCTLVSSAAQLTVSPLPIATVQYVQPSCTVPTGSITLTPSVGDGLTYSFNGGPFQAGTTFSNLSPGSYNLTIKSGANCTSILPVVIDTVPNAPAIATATLTQPGCALISTGIIQVTAPLGAGLTYSLNGGLFQAETTFSNLPSGSYTITVKNADGCTSVSLPQVILPIPIPPVAATATLIQPTCTTAGSLNITSPLGAGLTYSLNGGTFQSGVTFTTLAPGSYIITVKNSAGCISSSLPQIINPAPNAPAGATASLIQPTCVVAIGTITVTSPLGAGLTYSINGGPFQSTLVFSGLVPASYIITTKNADGCQSVSLPQIITPALNVPVVATAVLTQPTCDITSGSLTITAPIGAGLTYSINGGLFQSTTTFSSLAPGPYTITVKNADGCTSTSLPQIINAIPTAPVAAMAMLTQPTCSATTGTLTVTSPLGTGLTYSINGTTFQAGVTFPNLTPGSYTITVKSNGNCTSTSLPQVINAVPAGPAAATATLTQPTCAVATGTITVTGPAGAGLTYSINGTVFQTTTTFSNVAPGSYTITTKNTDGCTSTSLPQVINAITVPVIATAILSQPTCLITTGTITVTAPTGTGLTYSLNGVAFQATTLFSSLAPGPYTITVKNADGCTSTSLPQVINAIPTAPIAATAILIQPTCAVPTGTITVSAPIGTGLTYSLNGGAFQAGTTFSNLAPGSYTITVKSNGDCTSTSLPQIINAVPAGPAAAVATLTQPTCAIVTGELTVISPIDTGLTYSINGTTFQAGVTFANLAPGSYTITTKNTDGCTSVSLPQMINSVTVPSAATATLTQPTCAVATGSITIDAPVGPGFTYSLNGGAFQTGSTFSNLAPATYTIIVKNADGCTSAPGQPYTLVPSTTTTVQITGVQGCRATISAREYLLEALPLNNSFDVATADFKWTDSQGNVIANESNLFNVTEYIEGHPNAAFPITINVEVTAFGGCQNTYQFTVDGVFCDIQKGISPNNDSKNDSFNLTGLNVKKLAIFNRYGKEVYSRNDYKNEWFGQGSNDDELPSGTYYYMIETTAASQTGWVYINREE